MEILYKGTVSAQFRVNCPKLCENCVFPQNFHTRKLAEITVFFAVIDNNNLKWFASCLSRRKQYIKHKNIKTSHLDITCGILQESILGLLLFFLFISMIFIMFPIFYSQLPLPTIQIFLHLLATSKTFLIMWISN